MAGRTIVVFDTETTGIDVENDRIVTAFIGLMDERGVLVEEWNWLINPGIEIPEGATAVHGISTEVARERGVAPAQAVGEIHDLLQALVETSPLVIYNAPYDLTLLDREVRRHFPDGHLQFRLDRVIDPLVLDKKIYRFRKGKGMRQLANVAPIYGVPLERAHDARGDCIMTGRLAWSMLWRPEVMRHFPIEGLTIMQSGWASEQAAGLRAWFQKGADEQMDLHGPGSEEYREAQAKADSVDGHWPIRPFNNQGA